MAPPCAHGKRRVKSRWLNGCRPWRVQCPRRLAARRIPSILVAPVSLHILPIGALRSHDPRCHAALLACAAVRHLMRDFGHALKTSGRHRLRARRGATKLETEDRMLLKSRRLAFWMLLLSLVGLVPPAFSCTTSARSTDNCCPTGQRSPCVYQAPPITMLREQPCCAAQPTAQQSTITVTPSRRAHALPAPSGSGIGVSAGLATDGLLFNSSSRPSPVFARFDQRQIYLLTGRLRL